MEIGVTLPSSGPGAAPDAIYSVADRAEARGLDSVWTADHLAIPVDSSRSYPYFPGTDFKLDPAYVFYEPLVTLAAVAGRTERVRLGVSIYIAPFRHALVTAKLAATLDQLSRGRLLLGVGLGWMPEEYAAVGVDWEDRGLRLDEQIAYWRAAWSQPVPEYRGELHELSGLGFEPKPVGGDVPVWIGGNSALAERRAVRLGDGWHTIDLPPDVVEARLPGYRSACASAHRPAAACFSMRAGVQLTDEPLADAARPFPLAGSLDQIVDTLARYERAGVDHLALAPGLGSSEEPAAFVDWIADVLRPRLDERREG